MLGNSLEREGQVSQGEGEKARLRVGVVQERDSAGGGTSRVRWDDRKKEYHVLHGTMGKKEDGKNFWRA